MAGCTTYGSRDTTARIRVIRNIKRSLKLRGHFSPEIFRHHPPPTGWGTGQAAAPLAARMRRRRLSRLRRGRPESTLSEVPTGHAATGGEWWRRRAGQGAEARGATATGQRPELKHLAQAGPWLASGRTPHAHGHAREVATAGLPLVRRYQGPLLDWATLRYHKQGNKSGRM